MFCTQCGNRNPRNSRFCRHCGARLDLPGAARPIPDSEYLVEAAPATPESPERAARVQRLVDRALNLSERSENEAAILLLEQAVELDPRNEPAHSLLGLLFERTGNREEAIRHYETALEINPNSAIDRENLSRLKSLHAQALKTADSIRRVPPKGWNLRWLESPYFRATPVVASATLAVVIILVAQRLSPGSSTRNLSTNPTVASQMNIGQYVTLGKEMFSQGNYPKAQEYLRMALNLDPSHPEAQYWLDLVNQRVAEGNAAPQPGAPATTPAAPAVGQEQPIQVAEAPRTRESTTTPGYATAPLARTVPSVPARPPVAPAWTSRPSAPAPVVTQTVPSGSEVAMTPQPSPPQAGASGTGAVRRSPGRASVTFGEGTTPPAETSSASAGTATRPETQRSDEAAAYDYYMKGDSDKAEEALRSAVNSRPDSASLHQRLGLHLAQQGRYQEALAHLRQAEAAYRQQMTQGQGGEEARQGVKTCRTAITLCEKATGG